MNIISHYYVSFKTMDIYLSYLVDLYISHKTINEQ